MKFKRADRKSRTTPPLSGPHSPLGLPLQRGYMLNIINQVYKKPIKPKLIKYYPNDAKVLASEHIIGCRRR